GIRDRNVTGVQTCALPISNDIYVDIKSMPILIDGDVAGAIVSAVNVTEQKRQKEQIETLKNKVSVLSDNMKQLKSGNFRNIIYKSSVMEHVKNQIEKAAKTNANIL